jgi:hypothetical protein
MKYINIVLDIDLTLVEARNIITDDFDMIYVFDQPYYFIHGSKEFTKFAAELTNNKLIFFSNGSLERNNEFVPEFLTSIFSGQQLSSVSKNTEIYSRANRRNVVKDLLYVVDKSKLSETVLIDDDPINIAAGQEKNFLHVSPASMFRGNSFIVLNKLFYAAGILSLAFSLYQTRDEKFVDILHNIQKNVYNADIYYIGLKVLSKFNPNIKFKK